MNKLNVSLFFVFIACFLAVTVININAAVPASNILSLNKESIRLSNWQITDDVYSKDSLPSLSDSVWQVFRPAVKYTVGSWLIRTSITIEDSLIEGQIIGLFISRIITAYEVYWDGIRIAKNGTIGKNKTNEKWGNYYCNLPLYNESVKKGSHIIIVRLSNYYDSDVWKWYYGNITIGQYENTIKSKFFSGAILFIVTGVLLIALLFNLFLYFARRRVSEHLLFSLICLLVIFDILTNNIKFFIELPATYIFIEYYTYGIITILFNIFLSAFFIYKFSFPKILIVLIIILNITFFYFVRSPLIVYDVMGIIVLVTCSVISVWALYLRKEGSLIIFIGILAGWLAYSFNFTFAGLATTMVISTSFSIARQFARKERAEREAQLKSVRLENELLKKNINPHFVLNTLTSVIVWLRRDTNSAIKLVEALAEEFRMINQISALKQIPIKQEINLCMAHLKIMSYRKGAEYKLETLNIDENSTVPPMILHTIIENGLTHGYENKITGKFIIKQEQQPNSVQYIITNDGEFNTEDTKGSTGFGAKYIKGRLEESYPGKWKFVSHKLSNGWETVIEIGTS